MDTANSPTDSQQTASTLLFCRMCQSVYKQPKLLPCLHSFCGPCLVGAVTHGADGSVIVCPLCCHVARLSGSGVVGVPDNCFLDRMCQEYLTQVQSHLVARSLYPDAPASSSNLTIPIRRPSIELSPTKRTSLLSPRLQHTGPEDVHADEEKPDNLHADQNPDPAQTTASTAIEAIRNMSKLQTKIINLQGEALRVTYAIDLVNQYAADWKQHKEDFKTAVQRRSAQFQFFIQRMEHQIKTQIDSKSVDDMFYTESSKGKTELRKNLNNILHEVNVLKGIQEHGKDNEINALSSSLLGKSVGLSDVLFKKMHFDLDTPTKTIEDIVAAYYGDVKLDSDEINVYTPEIVDFNEVPVGNVAEPVVGGNYFRFDASRQMAIDEDKELDNAAIASAKRRSADRRSRRYNTDLGLNKQDVKDYLVQFQDARETFRNRRREILAQGHRAREDASPLRDQLQRRPESPPRKGRVQSLDRVALPIKIRDRTVPKTSLEAPEISTTRPVHGMISHSVQDAIPYPQPDDSFSNQSGASTSYFVSSLIPENMGIPSPIPEDVHAPISPQRKLVKQTSDPRFFRDMHQSPEDVSSNDISPTSHSQTLMQQLSNRRFSTPNSSLFSGRRHSDQFTSLPPGEQTALELLTQDRTTSRPLRRAITSAADRKTKIEFLRENWQKRKEILIQNEGFVSTDGVKQAVKTPEQIQPLLNEDVHSNVTSPDFTIAETHSSPSLESHDDPRHESMHQIRSRIAQYKHELNKRDESRQKEMKTGLSYPVITGSEQAKQNLQAEDNARPELVHPGTNTTQRLSGTADDVQKVYGTSTTTTTVEKVYRTTAAHEKGYGTTDTAEKVYGTTAAPEKLYGTTSTAEKVYGTTATAEKPTAERVYGTTATPEKVYGTSATAGKMYRNTANAEKVYGTTAADEKVYGTTAAVEKVYGTSTTVERLNETSAAEKIYGTSNVFGTSSDKTMSVSTRTTAARTLPEAVSIGAVSSAKAADVVSRPTAADRVYKPTISEAVSKPTAVDPVSRSTIPNVLSITPTVQTVSQTRISKETTPTTTMLTNIQHKQTSEASPNQPEASVTPPVAAPRSRYSRYQAKKTETLDVASLIAAMYSGNEKVLLHTNKPPSDESSKPSVPTPVTNSSTTTSISSSKAVDNTTFTESSRAAESSIVTERRNEESVKIADSKRDRESVKIAEKNTYADNIIVNNIKDEERIKTTEIGRAQEEVKEAEGIRTTEIGRAAEVTDARRIRNAEIGRAAEVTDARRIRNAEISRAEEKIQDAERVKDAETRVAKERINDTEITSLTSPSAITRHSYSRNAETPRELADATQDGHITIIPEGDHEVQQSLSSNISSADHVQKFQPRNPRHGARSRFTDGVNRRHTIEIGKDAIETARQMMARGETTTTYQAPLQPISESPSTLYTIPYHSRFSSLPKLEPTNGSSSITQPDADEATDSINAYTMRTPKCIPSPLAVIEEKPLLDQISSPQPTAALSPRTPPSPSSLPQNVIDQKLKLREIARKKKERWRHLTIH